MGCVLLGMVALCRSESQVCLTSRYRGRIFFLEEEAVPTDAVAVTSESGTSVVLPSTGPRYVPDRQEERRKRLREEYERRASGSATAE